MIRNVDAVALDAGSSFLRAVAGECLLWDAEWGRRGVIRRGAVADPHRLREHLRRAVGKASEVTLSMPVSASEVDTAELVEAAASGLRARRVLTLPAPVAALRSCPGSGPQVIVDVGSELVEISWAEPGGFHVGTRLLWGVDDVLNDLTTHLHATHGVSVPPLRLSSAWAGSVVAGRDTRSDAVRIVRITTSDVAAVVEQRADRIAEVVRHLLTAPHTSTSGVLLVGGGACVHDLRDAIARHVGTPVVVPPMPSHAVVRGLAIA